MEQATFAALGHDSKKRRTRRELFVEKKMDAPGGTTLQGVPGEAINDLFAKQGRPDRRPGMTPDA